MTAALLAIVFASANTGAALPASAAATDARASQAGCIGVMDVTPQCRAPAEAPAHVAADPKEADGARGADAWDAGEPAGASGGVALVGLGVAAAGAATLAASNLIEGDPHLRNMARVASAGLLVGAGLIGASAVSLWLFDPSSGELRAGGFPEER